MGRKRRGDRPLPLRRRFPLDPVSLGVRGWITVGWIWLATSQPKWRRTSLRCSLFGTRCQMARRRLVQPHSRARTLVEDERGLGPNTYRKGTWDSFEGSQPSAVNVNECNIPEANLVSGATVCTRSSLWWCGILNDPRRLCVTSSHPVPAHFGLNEISNIGKSCWKVQTVLNQGQARHEVSRTYQ